MGPGYCLEGSVVTAYTVRVLSISAPSPFPDSQVSPRFDGT